MKRFKLPKKAAHIGAWIMPNDIVDDICDYWNNPENDKIKIKGVFRKNKITGVHSSAKDSIDIGINPNNFDKPWGTYRKYLQDCLEDYLLQYPDADKVVPFNIREGYNIQWYPKGGGYKEWHHENAGDAQHIHRHLVFMTYCNDLPNAGTHFKYQNITTPSIKGLTLIWPAVFTHTHKGQITEEHEKMIVTGWFNFSDVFNKLGEQ
jgi:hypothetical protein